MPWFITLFKWESIIFEAILISLVGIPPGPVAFWGVNELISSLIFSVLALGKVKFLLALPIFLNSYYTQMIFIMFQYFFNCISI